MALNQANKLVRSYAVLMESLSRTRNKGRSQQKVTVEHVHVHAGGQAIVGAVTQRGGGDAKKSSSQPYATERPGLANGPGESECMSPLWGKDEERKAVPVTGNA